MTHYGPIPYQLLQLPHSQLPRNIDVTACMLSITDNPYAHASKLRCEVDCPECRINMPEEAHEHEF